MEINTSAADNTLKATAIGKKYSTSSIARSSIAIQTRPKIGIDFLSFQPDSTQSIENRKTSKMAPAYP